MLTTSGGEPAVPLPRPTPPLRRAIAPHAWPPAGRSPAPAATAARFGNRASFARPKWPPRGTGPRQVATRHVRCLTPSVSDTPRARSAVTAEQRRLRARSVSDNDDRRGRSRAPPGGRPSKPGKAKPTREGWASGGEPQVLLPNRRRPRKRGL